MIYPNTRQGRDKILDEIGRMIANGYKREDKKNHHVTLRKQVKQGKVTSETEVVTYIFLPDDVQIKKVVTVEYGGISKAKEMLFGWSSPNTEAQNAVRAGLFNESDLTILRTQYTGREWASTGD